jgi:hypothetical protein
MSLWMEYWPSADELWEEAQRERTALPHHEREAKRRAQERYRKAFFADLDRRLADLISGGHFDIE